MTKSNVTSFKALTSMALSLLATKDVVAESRVIKATTSLNYGRSKQNKGGYDYDLYSISLATPVLDDFDVSFTVGRDVMAGATVVYYAPGNVSAANLAKYSPTAINEVKTGSSVADYRNYISGKGRYFGKESAIFGETYHFGLTVGTSRENDYISNSAGLEYGRTFNEENTELTVSSTFNDNQNRRAMQTNSQLIPYSSVPLKTLFTQSYSISLRQDINDHSYVIGNFGYRRERGGAADPYKFAFFYGNALYLDSTGNYVIPAFTPIPGGYTTIHERRPTVRNDWTMNIKYVHFLKSWDSAIHLDYRYGRSDWEIKSHTFSAMYIQPISEKWEVAPSVRYYTQNEAFFHSPLFRAANYTTNPIPVKDIPRGNVYSSDYRLSSFGSLDTGFRISRKLLNDESGKLTFMTGVITRRNSFYWGKKPALKNPSNDFNNYYATVTLTYGLG